MQLDVPALRRVHYNATIAGLRRVHDDLAVVCVRPDAPIPEFDAGQWISIGLGMWEPRLPGLLAETVAEEERTTLVRRPFSIGSSILHVDRTRLLRPEEEHSYELYVALPRQAPQPLVITARLFALQPGSRLWVAERPRGANTLAGVRPEDDVLFAATGTGEAPHNRMIWELLRRGHRGRIASVVTTRRRADQGYRDVHRRVAELFSNYRYHALATREPGEKGAHLQDLLCRGELEAMAGFRLDPARARVFLCGNPAMIGAPRLHDGKLVYPETPGMVQLLERERGFRADPRDGNINIHFERY